MELYQHMHTLVYDNAILFSRCVESPQATNSKYMKSHYKFYTINFVKVSAFVHFCRILVSVLNL